MAPLGCPSAPRNWRGTLLFLWHPVHHPPSPPSGRPFPPPTISSRPSSSADVYRPLRLRGRVSRPYRELKGRFRKNGKSLRACQSAVRGFATIRLMMIHCSISSGSCGYQYPHHHHTLPEHTGIKIVSAIVAITPSPSFHRFFFFFFSSFFPFLSFPFEHNDPSRINRPTNLPFSLHFYSPRQIYPPNSRNLHMSAYFPKIRTVKLFFFWNGERRIGFSNFISISFGGSDAFGSGKICPKYFHIFLRATRVCRYHFSGDGRRAAGTSEFFAGEKRVTERGRSMRQDLCD